MFNKFVKYSPLLSKRGIIKLLMSVCDLTSDLLFKAIVDFQGQSYTKHAISALLLPVETGLVSSSGDSGESRP